MLIDRVERLSREAFVSDYLIANRPVIVTDAMNEWAARKRWTPDYFLNALGDLEVQVYNDLFDLVNVTTLSEYLAENFGRGSADPSTDYVRWYSKLKEIEYFPWADEAFERLRADWGMPYFLPREGYAVPRSDVPGELSAERSLFPYRGLFISGRGARTRLHRDPWTTAAILCQFHGSKKLTMYGPHKAPFFADGTGGFIDILKMDLEDVSKGEEFQPDYVDELAPGEVLFIPGGWLHDAETLSDSISVTWNFVHGTRAAVLADYIACHPDDSELEVMRFFSRDFSVRSVASSSA